MTAFVDTLTGSLNQAGSIAGRIGNFVWRALSFSLSDDLIAFQKNIGVALESDRASLALGTRFLARVKLLDTRFIPGEDAGPPSPDLLASSVAVYLTEKKATRAGVILTVPKAWVVTKVVDFPVTVRENLTEVVAFEMDRLTPFVPEEVHFDFQLLWEDRDTLRLAITAARADRIDPYISAFREKGIRITGITTHLVGVESLIRLAGGGRTRCFWRSGKKTMKGDSFRTGP